MTNEEVMERLKSIKYPGFSRDIVSFGIVKTVEVKGDSVRVVLLMSSASEESQKNIHQKVLSELEGSFSTVDIFLEQKNPAQNPAQTLNMIPEVKHTIAVASGKGGVGKSTVAVNIAAELMQRGHSVGLLDLDIYGPSLPILTGINEQPSMTSDKKLIPIEKHGIKLMSFGFLSGNDTPVIWRGPMVARMTEQFFGDVIWGNLDYLILDLPPGTGDIQLTLVQKLKISGAIIVTTPQDLAVSDVRKGADMFRKVNTPVLGVVENMSGLMLNGKVDPPESKLEINGTPVQKDANGHFDLKFDLFKVGGGEEESKRLGVPLLGQIPISEQIMLSTDKGKPLAMEENLNELGQVYANIANRILSTID